MEAPPPTRPLPAWLRKGTNGQLSGWGARGHRGGGDRGGGGPVPDEDLQRVVGMLGGWSQETWKPEWEGEEAQSNCRGNSRRPPGKHQICAAATADER